MFEQVVKSIIANGLAVASSSAERPFKLTESISLVFFLLVLVFKAPIYVQHLQQGLLVSHLVTTCKLNGSHQRNYLHIRQSTNYSVPPLILLAPTCFESRKLLAFEPFL